MHSEEIIPFVVQYMDKCGANMIFTSDGRVFDATVFFVGPSTIEFSAHDIFGDQVGSAKFGLHLFKSLISAELITEYLNNEVYDALADSIQRDGRAVLVLR
jgi:hypothetical protein